MRLRVAADSLMSCLDSFWDLGGLRKAEGVRDLSRRGYGRPGSRHALAPAYAVLRASIEKRAPEKGDLESFVALLNEPIALVPTPEGSHIFLAPERGSNRAVADAALAYINALAEYGEGLDVEPVSICPQCGGLFLRQRASKQYCTPRCRFAVWASEKGNQYFAEKARENRAAKRNLKKHKSR